MGRNLARNLGSRGFTVAVHNRTAAKTDALMAEHADMRAALSPSVDLASFVASLNRPRRVMVMVKAGSPTDATLDALVPLLAPDDIVVDAGNAHYAGHATSGVGPAGPRHPVRRRRRVRRRGRRPARTEHHARGRPQRLPRAGADLRGHRGPGRGSSLLRSMWVPTAPVTSSRWCTTASSTQTCNSSPRHTTFCGRHLTPPRRSWRRFSVTGTTAHSTRSSSRSRRRYSPATDPATGSPFVDVVRDEAEQKGTGRWTVQSALDLGVPISVIAEAVFARAVSGATGQRSAVRGKLGGVSDADVAAAWPGRTVRPSSSRCARRCTRRRWSHTRKAWT